MQRSVLVFVLMSCSRGAGTDAASPAGITRGGACARSIECDVGLHCTAGACDEPVGGQEVHAVAVADLQRQIAETRRLEKHAYTAQGKERMQKKRKALEARLTELGRR